MDETQRIEKKIRELVQAIGQHGHIRKLETDWRTAVVRLEIDLRDRFFFDDPQDDDSRKD